MDGTFDISQDEFEMIEAYLNGQLNEEALKRFEIKLNGDDVLKTKVETLKTILTGIETQALKEELDTFHQALEVTDKNEYLNKAPVKSLDWKRYAIAAVLIIAAGSFWLLNQDTNEALYAAYFTPDPGLPTTMSTSNNYEFNRAMVSYKQGHYDDAITTWKTLLQAKTKNDTLNYFIGSAFMASKAETEAIEYLESVTRQSATVFKSEAYFYLGLAYLKADKKEAAIIALKKSTLKESRDLLKKLE